MHRLLRRRRAAYNVGSSHRRPPSMAARKRRLNRDLLIVAVPATFVVVGAFALTLLLMRPAPPSELVMSTGTADGSYHAYAMKYRDILEAAAR
jgi:hypothetical protein